MLRGEKTSQKDCSQGRVHSWRPATELPWVCLDGHCWWGEYFLGAVTTASVSVLWLSATCPCPSRPEAWPAFTCGGFETSWLRIISPSCSCGCVCSFFSGCWVELESCCLPLRPVRHYCIPRAITPHWSLINGNHGEVRLLVALLLCKISGHLLALWKLVLNESGRWPPGPISEVLVVFNSGDLLSSFGGQSGTIAVIAVASNAWGISWAALISNSKGLLMHGIGFLLSDLWLLEGTLLTQIRKFYSYMYIYTMYVYLYSDFVVIEFLGRPLIV